MILGGGGGGERKRNTTRENCEKKNDVSIDKDIMSVETMKRE